MTRDFMRGWLRAYFDGEGTVIFRTHGKMKFGLRVTNTDAELDYTCRTYLDALGIAYSRLFTQPGKKGHKPAYHVGIWKSSEMLKYAELVGFAAPKKQERMSQIIAWINRDIGYGKAKCYKGHLYTPENTGHLKLMNGHVVRFCRKCRMSTQRRYRASRKRAQITIVDNIERTG